jgi:AAA domain
MRKIPPTFQEAIRNGHERTMFSAADLLDMELPAIKWTIPEILPEGVTILAGRSKIGKSFLAFGLCVAVATGGEALGKIPVGRGDVLLMALEDNKRRLKKRLKGLIGDADKAPDNLTIAIEWPRLDDGGVEKLDRWLLEHPDARLVVIDILKSIRPRGGQGRNIYDLDYESLEPLKPLIERHGVAIVVVHHLNQGQSPDPLTLISGSEGLVGVVDGTLVLRRERGKHDATLHVAGKDIEEEREHALTWDANLTNWTLVGDAQDFRMSDQRREIRAAMLGLSRPVTTAEVANKVDKDYQATRYLMVRMEEEGLIRLHHTDGATKYYIVPTNTPPKNPKNPKNAQDPKTAKSSLSEDGDLRDLRDLRTEEGGQSGHISADEGNRIVAQWMDQGMKEDEALDALSRLVASRAEKRK